MSYLLVTPASYAKLKEEIRSHAEQGKLSSPVTDAEARSLPYLQAVIKEGLRIIPPAQGPLYKEVPKGGDTILGHYLPAGTEIGHSTYSVQHRKDIWGEDADIFRPERWLEASEEQLKTMTSVVDLVFGTGQFQCLGRNVALMELNKAVVEVSA